MQLHHFAFEVSDLTRSIRFYEDAFGMKVTFRDTDAAHGESFAILSFGTGALELLQRIDAAEPFRRPEIGPPYCPHLAFQTEDVDATVQELTARGVRLAGGPFDSGKGIQWVYFADPDGNLIEFIHAS